MQKKPSQIPLLARQQSESKGFLLKARLENEPQIKITRCDPPVPRQCPRSGRTYADDGGDEEEHQHGDVEHDDPQQQKQHLGGGLGQNWRGKGRCC